MSKTDYIALRRIFDNQRERPAKKPQYIRNLEQVLNEDGCIEFFDSINLNLSERSKLINNGTAKTKIVMDTNKLKNLINEMFNFMTEAHVVDTFFEDGLNGHKKEKLKTLFDCQDDLELIRKLKTYYSLAFDVDYQRNKPELLTLTAYFANHMAKIADACFGEYPKDMQIVRHDLKNKKFSQMNDDERKTFFRNLKYSMYHLKDDCICELCQEEYGHLIKDCGRDEKNRKIQINLPGYVFPIRLHLDERTINLRKFGIKPLPQEEIDKQIVQLFPIKSLIRDFDGEENTDLYKAIMSKKHNTELLKTAGINRWMTLTDFDDSDCQNPQNFQVQGESYFFENPKSRAIENEIVEKEIPEDDQKDKEVKNIQTLEHFLTEYSTDQNEAETQEDVINTQEGNTDISHNLKYKKKVDRINEKNNEFLSSLYEKIDLIEEIGELPDDYRTEFFKFSSKTSVVLERRYKTIEEYVGKHGMTEESDSIKFFLYMKLRTGGLSYITNGNFTDSMEKAFELYCQEKDSYFKQIKVLPFAENQKEIKRIKKTINGAHTIENVSVRDEHEGEVEPNESVIEISEENTSDLEPINVDEKTNDSDMLLTSPEVNQEESGQVIDLKNTYTELTVQIEKIKEQANYNVERIQSLQKLLASMQEYEGAVEKLKSTEQILKTLKKEVRQRREKILAESAELDTGDKK